MWLFLFACNEYALQEEPKPVYPDLAVLPVVFEDGICLDEAVRVDLVSTGDADLTVTGIALDAADWSVDLPDLPFVLVPGAVETLAFYGAGDARLEVTSDDPEEPRVELAFSATANQAPTAFVTSPYEEQVLPAGGEFALGGFVADADDALEDLTLAWISSATGYIAAATADADGRVLGVWPAAGRVAGPQWVTLQVQDPCAAVGDGAMFICQDGPFVLHPIEQEAWHVEGAAALESGGITLTDPAFGSTGAAFDLASLFDGDDVELSFEFQVEPGSGGEGLSLTLLDADRREGFVGGDGCGLGFGGGLACTSGPALPGWSLAIDTEADETDCLAGPHVAFTFDGDVATSAACGSTPDLRDGAWHALTLRVLGQALTVAIDGVPVLETEVVGATEFQAYVGFTASTPFSPPSGEEGERADIFRVRALSITDFNCM